MAANKPRVKGAGKAAEVVASVGGAVFGSLVGGPVGAGISGFAALAPFLRELLAPAESARIERLLNDASTHVQELLSAGRQPRNDDFFEGTADARSSAEELTEGALRIAMQDHDEAKVALLARLLARLAFEEAVSRGQANFLLATAEALTYRQLLLLGLVGRTNEFPKLRKESYRAHIKAGGQIPMETGGLLQELHDLERRGLVSNGGSAPFGLYDMQPGKVTPMGNGVLLFKLMSLRLLQAEVFAPLAAPLE